MVLRGYGDDEKGEEEVRISIGRDNFMFEDGVK